MDEKNNNERSYGKWVPIEAMPTKKETFRERDLERICLLLCKVVTRLEIELDNEEVSDRELEEGIEQAN